MDSNHRNVRKKRVRSASVSLRVTSAFQLQSTGITPEGSKLGEKKNRKKKKKRKRRTGNEDQHMARNLGEITYLRWNKLMSLRWIPFASCWVCFYFSALICVPSLCYPAPQTRQQDSAEVSSCLPSRSLQEKRAAIFKALSTWKMEFPRKGNLFLSGMEKHTLGLKPNKQHNKSEIATWTTKDQLVRDRSLHQHFPNCCWRGKKNGKFLRTAYSPARQQSSAWGGREDDNWHPTWSSRSEGELTHFSTKMGCSTQNLSLKKAKGTLCSLTAVGRLGHPLPFTWISMKEPLTRTSARKPDKHTHTFVSRKICGWSKAEFKAKGKKRTSYCTAVGMAKGNLQ